MTREEAIKILKAIRVYECYPKSASEETKEAIDMAIEALQTDTIEFDFNKYQPSVRNKVYDKHDWVKVVRCKNCRHYIVEGITTQYGWCYEYKHSVDEDDYCSYGERQCNYFGERREP